MSNINTRYTSDESLAHGLKHAQQEALSALYDKYSALLFRVFQKMINDTADAEHALEMCFVTIWRNRNAYNLSKEKLFVWVFQIAINTANTVLQKKSDTEQNQIGKDSVSNRNYDWANANSLIEPILFGYISPQEVTEKTGIPICDLRKMLRKELNYPRGI